MTAKILNDTKAIWTALTVVLIMVGWAIHQSDMAAERGIESHAKIESLELEMKNLNDNLRDVNGVMRELLRALPKDHATAIESAIPKGGA
jgi:hypothetical protein